MTKEHKKPENKKSHEMSIEQILKSIRGIIQNKDDHQDITKNDISYSFQEPAPIKNDDEVLELTEVVHPKGFNTSIISEQVANTTSEIFKNFAKEAEAKEAGVASHFNNASNAINTGVINMEDLIVKSIRPHLTEWLDRNLPTIVKQVVEKEIKKLVPEKP